MHPCPTKPDSHPAALASARSPLRASPPSQQLSIRIPSLELVLDGFRYLTAPVELLARLASHTHDAPANRHSPEGDSSPTQAGGIHECQFRKAGSHWDVRLDGGPLFHLADSLGARYLDYLLHRPNLAISAYDLETAIHPEKAVARGTTSIQSSSDKQAIQRYLRELTRLRSARDEAGEQGDFGAVDRLDQEIAQFESALKSGGLPADAGERARNNVRKAIAALRDSLKKGEKTESDFGQHIRQFVNTGYECIYHQPPGRAWS
jgi:hypothetical protein